MYVEVQKITILYQNPKQHKGLKSRKHLGFHKGRGPNPLKVHRKGPKPMDGQALDLMKQRKEEVQPSPQR